MATGTKILLGFTSEDYCKGTWYLTEANQKL